MIKEISYGILPLKKRGNSWEIFLVQHGRALFWGYPKGHAEAHETPHEAAQRELEEETGLKVVRFLKDEPFEEHYFFTFKGQKISKTVQLFAAVVKGTVKLQSAEIGDGKWVPIDEALSVITYSSDKQVFVKMANELLNLAI